MIKSILTLITLSGILLSCQKEAVVVAEKNCELNAANLVGSYKIASIEYKKDSASAPIDEFATYEACKKDDLVIFNANNTITFSDAGIVCNPNGNRTGKWTLSGDKIVIDSAVYNVLSFSCKSIKATYIGHTKGEISTVVLDRN